MSIRNIVLYLYIIKLNNMTTIVEMVSTGLYDEKAINKFYNRQLKLNANNVSIAEAMVRIYKHTFLIRTPKTI